MELEGRIDPGVAARAAAIARRWEMLGHGSGVSTYAAALLRYDPIRLAPEEAEAAAREAASADAPFPAGRLVEIPTRYDGPDLEEVARLSGLTVAELVEAHTSREHLAYFLGFMPGFAYCGGLDPRIIAPRLPSPRTRVAAGSVAVADGQTAVYPMASPGGWRIIGVTDLVVFDARRDAPALIAPGDRVRFVAR